MGRCSLDADADLFTKSAVDPDDALAAVLGISRPDSRDGTIVVGAGQQDVIAVLDAEFLHRHPIDGGESAAGVFLFERSDCELHT